MTKIKLCGLSRECDIDFANELMPDYIGFIFAKNSRRCVSFERAEALKIRLSEKIKAAGVFVNEEPAVEAELARRGIIDVIQLHGDETEEHIKNLRALTSAPIIKAFKIKNKNDIEKAQKSSADMILLDSASGGSGLSFDRALLSELKRSFFLAGGLYPETVEEEIKKYAPYGVDVSTGIETDGLKDKNKMKAFVTAVRASDAREDK